MSAELKEALEILEKEKSISKAALLEGIEQSLMQACKNHFGKADNVVVEIDPDTCNFSLYANREVVEQVEDPALQISLMEAKKKNASSQIGDVVRIPIESKSFGRIATQNAKNVILQKIREEERRSLFNRYHDREHNIVSGIVQRTTGRYANINLGKVDAFLSESEMIPGERLRVRDRIRVYVLEVKDTPRGPKVQVSRSHPELVKRLFEAEVGEIAEGIIEIKSIAREAGSRTKMAVYSNDPYVDAVGACVGMNGIRVGAVVDELGGEKVDIINWDENPALLIENALSPAKIISVLADPDDKSALVIVPDYQLSLAIGKEGQNARLAAKLTGFKIDIKSETQAREAGIFDEYFGEDYEDEYGEEYAEGYGEEYSEEFSEDYSGESDEEYAGEYDDEPLLEDADEESAGSRDEEES